MIQKTTLFFVALLFMAVFTSCRKDEETSTPTMTAEAGETPTDTPVPAGQTPSATETEAIEAATATAEFTATNTATATEFSTIALELCQTQLEDLCVLSLYPLGFNSLALNLISNLQGRGEMYYLIYENIDVTCTVVEESENQYFCPNVPNILDRTIFLQVFNDEEHTMLMGEGQFFFSTSVIIGPTPTTAATQKPTPPSPYNP